MTLFSLLLDFNSHIKDGQSNKNLYELGDDKKETKMVTSIASSTTMEDKEKTSNCITPKKTVAISPSVVTPAESATEQTAPNILVYKKVRRCNVEKEFRNTT